MAPLFCHVAGLDILPFSRALSASVNSQDLFSSCTCQRWFSDFTGVRSLCGRHPLVPRGVQARCLSASDFRRKALMAQLGFCFVLGVGSIEQREKTWWPL